MNIEHDGFLTHRYPEWVRQRLPVVLVQLLIRTIYHREAIQQ